jgi:predicted ATPase
MTMDGNGMTKVSSDTILDLLRASLLRLPRLVQEVHKVASYMGNEVDDYALALDLQTKLVLI